MKSPFIVVGNVFVDQPLQLLVAKHEPVIQAFGPRSSYPSFGDRVGFRRLHRRPNLCNAQGSSAAVECITKAAVAVMNQITRRLPTYIAGLCKLLREPFCRRIRRYTSMDDFP